jgi:hypothetical protein
MRRILTLILAVTGAVLALTLASSSASSASGAPLEPSLYCRPYASRATRYRRNMLAVGRGLPPARILAAGVGVLLGAGTGALQASLAVAGARASRGHDGVGALGQASRSLVIVVVASALVVAGCAVATRRLHPVVGTCVVMLADGLVALVAWRLAPTFGLQGDDRYWSLAVAAGLIGLACGVVWRHRASGTPA